MVINRRQNRHGCWGCLQVSRTMTKAENQTNAKLQTEGYLRSTTYVAGINLRLSQNYHLNISGAPPLHGRSRSVPGLDSNLQYHSSEHWVSATVLPSF